MRSWAALRPPRLRRRGAGTARGFTLLEVLIATTILSIMTVAILGLFLNLMKSYKYNTFRLSINKDVRTFTNELILALEGGMKYADNKFGINLNAYATNWKNKPFFSLICGLKIIKCVFTILIVYETITQIRQAIMFENI